MTEASEQDTAVHEAGHVVAILLHGYSFQSVQLLDEVQDLHRAGVITGAERSHGTWPFCCLAGDAAMAALLGCEPAPRWDLPTNDWAQALASVRATRRELTESAARDAVRRIFEDVERQFRRPNVARAIEALAAALLRRRRLTHAECLAVVRAATPRAMELWP